MRIILFIAIIGVYGCGMPLQKQQQIAEQFYKKYPDSLAKKCMEKFPPKVGEVKEGKTQTDTVVVTDSAAVNRFKKRIDSLLKNPVVKVTAANEDSIRNAIRTILIKQFQEECKSMQVNNSRTDTLPVADSAAIKFWIGAYHTERDLRIKTDAKLELTETERDEWKATAKKRWWIIAGLIALFGLATYLRIKRIL